MTRYLKFVIPALLLAGVLVVLMVNLSSALVYFNTPSPKCSPAKRAMNGCGSVVGSSPVPSSRERASSSSPSEDCDAAVAVAHTGVPPQLFQEGIGVVVEGTWDGAVFSSDTMLVKHDEQYQTDYEDYDENKHACDEA